MSDSLYEKHEAAASSEGESTDTRSFLLLVFRGLVSVEECFSSHRLADRLAVMSCIIDDVIIDDHDQ